MIRPDVSIVPQSDSKDDLSPEFGQIILILMREFAPRHKTNTCRKNLEELIFVQRHVGPVFAIPRIRENILEEFV